MLEKGKPNDFESVELARPVLQQDRTPLLEKWLKENQDLQVVIQVASKYPGIIEPVKLFEMFESFKTFEDLSFKTLGSIVNLSHDPRSTSWISKLPLAPVNTTRSSKSVGRIYRESNRYNPEKVKNSSRRLSRPVSCPSSFRPSARRPCSLPLQERSYQLH